MILVLNQIKVVILLKSLGTTGKKDVPYFTWKHLDSMPYLIISCCFKVLSIVIITTYLTTWSVVPILSVVISTFILTEIMSIGPNERAEQDARAPRWILFISSLFVTFISSTKKLSKLYAFQMLASVIIYISTLITLLLLKEFTDFKGTIDKRRHQ